jgi:hypothetical protein
VGYIQHFSYKQKRRRTFKSGELDSAKSRPKEIDMISEGSAFELRSAKLALTHLSTEDEDVFHSRRIPASKSGFSRTAPLMIPSTNFYAELWILSNIGGGAFSSVFSVFMRDSTVDKVLVHVPR